MSYLAPIHAPSSVRQALKLNLLEAEQECLVVAKSNRLEIYEHTAEGLSLKTSRSIYGRITVLERLRPASSVTDHLFVGTDRYMYLTLSWDPLKKQFRTEKSFVDMTDRTARESQTGDRCSKDATESFLALEIYEGNVSIIPISKKPPRKASDPEIGSLLDPISVRIPEMFVRSTVFVELRTKQNDKPNVAMLYEDPQRRVKLKLRSLEYTPGLGDDAGSAELNDIKGLQEELEAGASHLIPIPAPACGVMVLAETSLMYYEYSSQERIRRPLREATIFVAWEQIDQQRFILADDYGKLYLLMLEIDQRGSVGGWKLDELGQTSRASILVYLSEGRVFVGSHQGDSQVIAIRPQAIEILQTFPNIAPILDFTIMDMGGRASESQTTNEFSSGQARLVTGSGAFNDGSLRSVRSGVGLEDLGVLDAMENVTEMFSLRSSASSSFVDTLVVSHIDETRIFTFGSDGGVEEADEFKGLSLDRGTLFAANVGERIIQVTQSGVILVDQESGMKVADWVTPGGQAITAVAASQQIAVIAIGGLRLVALDITKDLAVTAERQFENSQIACVGVSPSKYPYCIVGFWETGSIAVLGLSDLQDRFVENLKSTDISVPRSILLVDVLEDSHPTLFFALADGNVVTYTLNPADGSLSGRKSVILGTQEATFKAIPRTDGSGLYNVFATCEHPSLIYGSESRLIFSAVTVEKASSVCPFDAEKYPGSIAIAAADGLRIALIDEERSTHVQGLHVGETVRRLAYSSELKAFGMGTIKRYLEGNNEVHVSYFKIAGEVAFQIQSSYELKQDELVESVMRCQLPDGSGRRAERFVVGTAYLEANREDAIRGRIIVFEVTEDQNLKVVTEHDVKGACRCLAVLDDRIVAALIKTVVIYSLEYETASKPFLTKKASYRTSTAPIDLAVDAKNRRIAVADLMKSVSVLEYQPSTIPARKDTLVEIARHFQTTWATSVSQISSLEDDPAPLQDPSGKNIPTIRFLEADAEGNLLLLNHNTDAFTSEEKRRLVVMSEMNLGEMVNRMRPIAVTPAPDAAVIPRAFLATTEGSIFMFALIAPSRRDQLMKLQALLADIVESLGNVPFNGYRAYKSLVRQEEEPLRFVDGELVEQFLNLDEPAQAKIAEQLQEDLESLRSMVEGLRRLR